MPKILFRSLQCSRAGNGIISVQTVARLRRLKSHTLNFRADISVGAGPQFSLSDVEAF